LRATLGPVRTGLADLAACRPDTAYESARKLYNEADLKAREASAKHQDADRKVREAADRVSGKRLELSTLTSDLARARTDLRNATLLEARARQEAQAACIEMTELDAQVRVARYKLNAQVNAYPPRAVARDNRSSSKK
jgi:chromosome segregation ATPase